MEKWKEFYTDRGGKDFFGCDIDDPEIRFGSLTIGQLSYASINEEIIDVQSIGGMLKLKVAILENDVESFTVE